ncbi:DBF4-type zinc finger-containing protein 2 homolog [Pundamilia nyererei]|uniref:DBF4-type zinc finger-containing protein 2 homolog n=1 Tax=Pundamilia nyererei TaxID=303518 RepID=A0A9Y3RKK8_9CICH|nr:PREDICTED: DBF4-type zinc finger-containing protein 2 homolog [Pundamilia nyererei]
MELRHYVNSSVGRRARTRDNQSGGAIILKLVGISFGLLCIIQSAVNVYIWLQADGTSGGSKNNSTCNITLLSPDDISAVLLERDQLLQEKKQLTEANDRLNQYNERLLEENSQLYRHETQLIQEKKQLEKKNNELKATNRRLTEQKRMCNDNIISQQVQIRDLQSELDRVQPSACATSDACPPNAACATNDAFPPNAACPTNDAFLPNAACPTNDAFPSNAACPTNDAFPPNAACPTNDAFPPNAACPTNDACAPRMLPTRNREEVQRLTEWCSSNNLVLNTSKTKEVIADYRIA